MGYGNEEFNQINEDQKSLFASKIDLLEKECSKQIKELWDNKKYNLKVIEETEAIRKKFAKKMEEESYANPPLEFGKRDYVLQNNNKNFNKIPNITSLGNEKIENINKINKEIKNEKMKEIRNNSKFADHKLSEENKASILKFIQHPIMTPVMKALVSNKKPRSDKRLKNKETKIKNMLKINEKSKKIIKNKKIIKRKQKRKEFEAKHEESFEKMKSLENCSELELNKLILECSEYLNSEDKQNNNEEMNNFIYQNYYS